MRAPLRADFRPPFRADFFLAPFFAAIRSAPVLEWSTHPIPRWIGGRGSARHGTKPERTEPTVRGRGAAREVAARTAFARKDQVSRAIRHHLLSTIGGASLLPRASARGDCADKARARLVQPGAPTPDFLVGWLHRSTSVGRDLMQYGFGRRETSAATLCEMQLVVDRPPVHCLAALPSSHNSSRNSSSSCTMLSARI